MPSFFGSSNSMTRWLSATNVFPNRTRTRRGLGSNRASAPQGRSMVLIVRSSRVLAMGNPLLFVVALMIFLGRVKHRRRLDHCHDAPPLMLLRLLQRGPGGGLLRRGLHENRGPVLTPDVRTLTVGRGRIMHAPEGLQQLVERHPGGIKLHLDRLGVASPIPADISIGGLGHGPADIADSSVLHPGDPAELRFYPPKASGSERGLFHTASVPRTATFKTG